MDTATPAVEFTYARDGLVSSVLDGTGTRTYEYDPVSRQPTAEGLPAYFGASRRLSYRYDGPVAGRLAGYRFHDSVDHLNLGFDYQESTGRLASISSTARVGAKTYENHTFDYAYLPGSDLVRGLTQGAFTREQTWQSWGDAAETWTTRHNSTTQARFAYGYDDTARRTQEDLTGPLAATLGYTAQGYRDSFTPDARSQIAAIRRHSLNAAGQPLAGEATPQRRDWNFDALGNRTLETRATGSINYTVNNLNQYSALTGLLTDTLTHDFDGNRSADSTWNYIYDGENRLITMTRKVTGLQPQRLDFAYDHQHRRVAKIARSGTAANATITAHLRFVHQGYQLVAELNGSTFAVERSYTWGLDLSGTVGGGGGVGGLLQIHDAESRYHPLYNANGNVRGLLTADAFGAFAAGAIVAAYDYNVFGEAIATVGTATIAQANPIRFASKYLDTVTGLYDYNHRFYDPVQGRFINRDPIGEEGGLNLYAYVRNRGADRWDWLGLSQTDGEVFYLPPITVVSSPIHETTFFVDTLAFTPSLGEQGGNPNSSPSYVAPNNPEREKRKKECDGLKARMEGYARIGREQIADIGTTGRELNRVGDYYAYGGLAVVTAGSIFDTFYGASKAGAEAVKQVNRFNDIVDGTPFLIHETRESWKSGYSASVELSTYATEGLTSGAKELAQWGSITNLVHDKVNGVLRDTINADMRSLTLDHADTMNKFKNTQREFNAKGCNEFY